MRTEVFVRTHSIFVLNQIDDVAEVFEFATDDILLASHVLQHNYYELRVLVCPIDCCLQPAAGAGNPKNFDYRKRTFGLFRCAASAIQAIRGKAYSDVTDSLLLAAVTHSRTCRHQQCVANIIGNSPSLHAAMPYPLVQLVNLCV